MGGRRLGRVVGRRLGRVAGCTARACYAMLWAHTLSTSCTNSRSTRGHFSMPISRNYYARQPIGTSGRNLAAASTRRRHAKSQCSTAAAPLLQTSLLDSVSVSVSRQKWRLAQRELPGGRPSRRTSRGLKVDCRWALEGQICAAEQERRPLERPPQGGASSRLFAAVGDCFAPLTRPPDKRPSSVVRRPPPAGHCSSVGRPPRVAHGRAGRGSGAAD